METYAPTSHQERSAPPASATKKQHRASLSLQDNRPAAIQLRKTIQAIQASSNRLSPIQCYTKGITYKTSDNENFRTCINDTNLLDKKTGATTSIDNLLVRIGTVNGYQRYQYNTHLRKNTKKGIERNFVNDCGFFSDFLMTLDTTALAGRGNPHVKAGTGTNDAADPLAGEAYFMQGNTEANIDLGCVHHQATVIAKDGGDNITCEANAGARLTAPIFDMYGTAEETFHSRFKDDYGDDDHPATTEVYEK